MPTQEAESMSWFLLAICFTDKQVGPSVAYDAASMNELRKWNEQYGEGGNRRRSPFGFGS